ncbi:unnamed protein product [Lactuca virosa]|uniref:Uncharacterized protein n=1 Tax=Lactuca virosa TaxID=75947 RepID=A0AAU9M7Q3_9ASTR|nr:unnamed protein product [Lactuca virosa]
MEGVTNFPPPAELLPSGLNFESPLFSFEFGFNYVWILIILHSKFHFRLVDFEFVRFLCVFSLIDPEQLDFRS